MNTKRIILSILLVIMSFSIYADNYKFDYAVIDNEKVTTVSAPNITANLISSYKATVTYGQETITLTSKDGYEYVGYGQNKVMIVANKINGALSRITIGCEVKGQIVMLIYKRVK